MSIHKRVRAAEIHQWLTRLICSPWLKGGSALFKSARILKVARICVTFIWDCDTWSYYIHQYDKLKKPTQDKDHQPPCSFTSFHFKPISRSNFSQLPLQSSRTVIKTSFPPEFCSKSLTLPTSQAAVRCLLITIFSLPPNEGLDTEDYRPMSKPNSRWIHSSLGDHRRWHIHSQQLSDNQLLESKEIKKKKKDTGSVNFQTALPHSAASFPNSKRSAEVGVHPLGKHTWFNIESTEQNDLIRL
jgi:hypothetical protein